MSRPNRIHRRATGGPRAGCIGCRRGRPLPVNRPAVAGVSRNRLVSRKPRVSRNPRARNPSLSRGQNRNQCLGRSPDRNRSPNLSLRHGRSPSRGRSRNLSRPPAGCLSRPRPGRRPHPRRRCRRCSRHPPSKPRSPSPHRHRLPNPPPRAGNRHPPRGNGFLRARRAATGLPRWARTALKPSTSGAGAPPNQPRCRVPFPRPNQRRPPNRPLNPKRLRRPRCHRARLPNRPEAVIQPESIPVDQRRLSRRRPWPPSPRSHPSRRVGRRGTAATSLSRRTGIMPTASR